jgi:4-hydroxy-tetrahydrodipicolinate reductase
MKIAIVGYGKMGQMIDRLATGRGIDVALKLDEHNNANYAGITAENFRGIDAAIEFSTPSTVLGNIERIAALGVNLVIGTTGWHEQLDRVKSLVTQHDIGLVWSPNYSVGVNAFLRIVQTASKLLDASDYEAWAWEIHHSTKKDAPSGTLIKLVEQLGGRHADVASNRAGVIPGTHEIGFDSPADTITLRHTARNREGFALGAIKAAQWVTGRKGFHEFGDILFEPTKMTEPRA